MKHALLIILVMFVLQAFVTAQQPKPFIFSPPDHSFSVELPASAKVEKQEASAEVADFDDFFGGIQNSSVYLIKLGSDEIDPSVSVGFFDLIKPVDQKTFTTDVNSYMLFFFGDNKRFSKKANAVVNGIFGREFVFEKGVGSGRALWVNSGKRIYLLSYFIEEGGEPTSEVVNKIFASFKPVK